MATKHSFIHDPALHDPAHEGWDVKTEENNLPEDTFAITKDGATINLTLAQWYVLMCAMDDTSKRLGLAPRQPGPHRVI